MSSKKTHAIQPGQLAQHAVCGVELKRFGHTIRAFVDLEDAWHHRPDRKPVRIPFDQEPRTRVTCLRCGSILESELAGAFTGTEP